MKNLREEIRKLEELQECDSSWIDPDFEDDLVKLFRSWVLGMVKEVRDVNESNGRYNACNEMEKKIEETGK